MSDMNQLLLNMMLASRTGQDTRPMMEEMLNSSGDLDPTTRLLLTQAMSGDERDDDAHADDIVLDQDDYTPLRRQPSIERLYKRFERMTQQLEELSEELDLLQERNDELAAALGACDLCWGEDAECSVCAGQGKPGSIAPDRHLYRKWILPAVRTVQALQQRRLARQAQMMQVHREEHNHGG